jgi:hypothetical protein
LNYICGVTRKMGGGQNFLKGTVQRYGFHPLRSVTAALCWDVRYHKWLTYVYVYVRVPCINGVWYYSGNSLDAVCTHRMATIRVDIPPSMKPHYEYSRRIPWVKHAAIDAEIAEWLRDGVIEKCPESSPWNPDLVVVNKATECDTGVPQRH